jgi:hypothetical protein
VGRVIFEVAIATAGVVALGGLWFTDRFLRREMEPEDEEERTLLRIRSKALQQYERNALKSSYWGDANANQAKQTIAEIDAKLGKLRS